MQGSLQLIRVPRGRLPVGSIPGMSKWNTNPDRPRTPICDINSYSISYSIVFYSMHVYFSSEAIPDHNQVLTQQ